MNAMFAELKRAMQTDTVISTAVDEIKTLG